MDNKKICIGTVIILVIIYCIMYKTNTENYDSFCGNCQTMNALQCSQCQNCGTCTSNAGYKVCLPGDQDGPYFHDDCTQWHYPHQKTNTKNDYEFSYPVGAHMMQKFAGNACSNLSNYFNIFNK